MGQSVKYLLPYNLTESLHKIVLDPALPVMLLFTKNCRWYIKKEKLTFIHLTHCPTKRKLFRNSTPRHLYCSKLTSWNTPHHNTQIRFLLSSSPYKYLKKKKKKKPPTPPLSFPYKYTTSQVLKTTPFRNNNARAWSDQQMSSRRAPHRDFPAAPRLEAEPRRLLSRLQAVAQPRAPQPLHPPHRRLRLPRPLPQPHHSSLRQRQDRPHWRALAAPDSVRKPSLIFRLGI